MIQANELRIGNLIQANGPIMEVRRVGEASVELYLHGSEADNWDEDLEDCTPIPLTPEILIAAGFREENKAEWSIEYENDFFIVAKNLVVGVEIYLGFDVDIYHEVLYERIKYVHQLQNLIYALSGNELTIKL